MHTLYTFDQSTVVRTAVLYEFCIILLEFQANAVTPKLTEGPPFIFGANQILSQLSNKLQLRFYLTTQSDNGLKTGTTEVTRAIS